MWIDWAGGLFMISVGVVLYAYAGLPALVYLMAKWRPRPVHKADVRPKVSLIIAAYNEEKTIQAKLENALALTYPKDKFEILVAAHGSNDETVNIARRFETEGVRVLHAPAREGKAAAMNRAVAEATGEIYFFSDANTVNSPGTVEALVRSFADPGVGAVSGRKVVLQDKEREASGGENAYWTYETTLKQLESLAGSIVTADGEIFAVRAELYNPMPRHIVHDDMYLSLKIVDQGYRVVYENAAVSAEYASCSLEDEFHLKMRYSAGGFQLVKLFRRLLLPPRSWFAIQFLSHKVLRWLAPVFLGIGLVASGCSRAPVFQIAFVLQAAFYLTGLLAWLTRSRFRSRLLYFPLYFCVMNMAVLCGFARQFAFAQTPLWRKAQR